MTRWDDKRPKRRGPDDALGQVRAGTALPDGVTGFSIEMPKGSENFQLPVRDWVIEARGDPLDRTHVFRATDKKSGKAVFAVGKVRFEAPLYSARLRDPDERGLTLVFYVERLYVDGHRII